MIWFIVGAALALLIAIILWPRSSPACRGEDDGTGDYPYPKGR